MPINTLVLLTIAIIVLIAVVSFFISGSKPSTDALGSAATGQAGKIGSTIGAGTEGKEGSVCRGSAPLCDPGLICDTTKSPATCKKA